MRFNHVFFLIMLLAGLSAFAVPRRFTDGGRPLIGAVFSPVARPVRSVASAVTNRVSPPATDDPRPRDDVYRENMALRQQQVALQNDVQRLSMALGEQKKYNEPVTAVAVAGAVSEQGDSLLLSGSTLTGLENATFALADRNVIGRLVAGRGGTQVRLVTHPQSKIMGYFGKFQTVSRPATRPGDEPEQATSFVPLPLGTRLILGVGQNKMVCLNVPLEDIRKSGLAPGDWVFINDSDWSAVRDRAIGVVKGFRGTGKLMATIDIEPHTNLLRLGEVMVRKSER
ncbi:MAG TPA: hypothetical protein VF796_15895 [Humisphaera sp.]